MSSFWNLTKLLPVVGRARTTLLAVMTSLDGLLKVAINLAAAAVVGSVPGAVRYGFGSPQGRALVVWLVAGGALYIAEQTLGPARNAYAAAHGSRVALWLRETVMHATLAPGGIAHLEDPAMHDEIVRAGEWQWGVVSMRRTLIELCNIVASRLTALTSAAVLATWRWWAPFVLAAASWVGGRPIRITNIAYVRAKEQHAATQRRSEYTEELVLGSGAAKELRIFGILDWLKQRHLRDELAIQAAVNESRRLEIPAALGAIAVTIAANALVLASLGADALAGRISIGVVAAMVQSALILNYVFRDMDTSWIHQAAACIPHALALRDKTRAGDLQSGTLRPPRGVIRFERVCFAYPFGGSVFDGIDLAIEPGQRLAIVGANGAGKTTLIKLLARLYEPTAGRITVGGVDLREIDVDTWREQIAAIFQDFVRYDLPARDNIEFDGKPDVLTTAARRAGALETIERIGWETSLSRAYEPGADLSGGEWQRVALARALRKVERGASILVLDEPTANLDVHAELQIFDTLLDAAPHVTTILISHRFSTVRRADRIVVVDHGRIIEDGTHESLLAAGGRYARMFTLQAARFNGDALGVDSPEGHADE